MLPPPPPPPAAWPTKLAVTVVLAERVTVQSSVALHPSPLHPENVEVPFGVAVKVIGAPFWKLAEQVAPQSIPDGLLVTVPPPVSASAINKVLVAVLWVKVALTAVSAASVNSQG